MLASYVMELAYNLKNCAALGTRQQHGGLPEASARCIMMDGPMSRELVRE